MGRNEYSELEQVGWTGEDCDRSRREVATNCNEAEIAAEDFANAKILGQQKRKIKVRQGQLATLC